MKVLVAVASRHGSTREIGEAIAGMLRETGHDVVVAAPDDVTSLRHYDAVVLGSCVYVGRWNADARSMVERLGPSLAARPLWLFSSGPVGDPLVPEGEPEDVAEFLTRLGARGHRTFAGRIDRTRLSLAERAVAALLQAPDGDFRSWAEIRDWGRAIGLALAEERVRAS